MEKLYIHDMSRAEVRDSIVNLPRNEAFLLEELSDGTKVYITTDGSKNSKVDGEIVGNYDCLVHSDGLDRDVSYIEDVLRKLDRLEQSLIVDQSYGEAVFDDIISATKDAIELSPVDDIIDKYDIPVEYIKENYSINVELLLSLLKAMAIVEDVNYWGEKYEGRYMPYNAIIDMFENDMGLSKIIRKYQL